MPIDFRKGLPPPLRAVDLRDYVRRPDSEFWFELLKPMPSPTDEDQQRRFRLTRYSMGVGFVIAVVFACITPWLGDKVAPAVCVVNLLAAAAFAFGIWMGSLGKGTLARCLLLAVANLQVAVLVFLTGEELGIGVYALVGAVMARALFGNEEVRLRVIFAMVSMIVFAVSMSIRIEPFLDMASVPSDLLAWMRILNALLALECVILVLALFQKEVLVSERSLLREYDRSDRLLQSVLPGSIARRLRDGEKMIADHHPSVTVLFADIAGFTPWSAQQSPDVVVGLLEKIFTHFDECVAEAGVEKIKTIGDAYMVMAGAPAACPDHAERLARLALRLRHELEQISVETGIPVDIRIGLHSGPAIAGVLGSLRFTYDVWGDTVNTASRMESHGEAGRIHLSEATRALLPASFVCEPRGMITVKGKGLMTTWWLQGLGEQT
jgi:adenylate cyclase